MVLDSSALVAIVLAEPEAEQYVEVISQAEKAILSAPTFLELSIVLFRRGGNPLLQRMDRILEALEIRIVPFQESEAFEASSIYQRYGPGQHPAQLNFGDCISFAVARSYGEPLLFNGDDFARTSVSKVF